MPRSSEPVRAQKRETKVDEQARRDCKAQDEIDHGAPSHPLGGTHDQCKGGEARKAKGKVKEVKHRATPVGCFRTVLPDRVKALFETIGSRVSFA
jgi:hypothetical protein